MKKDMAEGKHRRNDNLNRNKQGIQAKMDCPTVLKLILISVHSNWRLKKEYRNPNCDYRGSEGPQMHPHVEREP